MAKDRTTTKKPPRKKRRGLRFFLSLLVIIAAGGAVFWFGWVQFSLDEGQIGVVYTKSHGYETEPLVSGEFAWRWQALLPTNLTLHVFDAEPRSFTIQRDGTMPSGDLYAAMAGDGVDFGWSVTARLRYRIAPEAVPALVADGSASNGMDDFYADFEAKAAAEFTRMLAESPFDEENASIGADIKSLEETFRARVSALDTRVTVLEASILDWRAPDLVLYAEARRLYLEYMGLRQAVLTEVEDDAVRREDIQGARIDLLARYGEILAAYPVLLDLFALEGNPGAALLPPAEIR